jgi:hypothetical protein
VDRTTSEPPGENLVSRLVGGKLRRRLGRAYARLTAAARQLPGFIVIGAHKGGTSSMQGYSIQHPRLFGASRKEVHFFDLQYQRGEGWYRSKFPRRSSLPEGSLTCDATPLYMTHPLVPARVARMLPHVKLVVLLRDPVARAISHYHHQVRQGRETLSIADALAAEAGRVAEEKRRLLNGEDIEPAGFRRFSYTERGLYAEQLERWFEHFPRGRFFIETSERFYDETESVLRELFAFLGVDDTVRISDLRPRNVGPRREDDPELRARLAEFFAPHNRRLERLLGRTFDWQ